MLVRWFYKPLSIVLVGGMHPLRSLTWLMRKMVRLVLSWKTKFLDEKIIVFMGTDGSGKTTMIETIKQVSNEKWTYVHMGNKSNFLPTTALINKYRRANQSSEISRCAPIVEGGREGGQVKECGFIKDSLVILKEFIYKLNYRMEIYTHIQYLRFRSIIRGQKVRLLVDRYIYDGYKCGGSLRGYTIFPRPDLIVLMEAPIDVLLTRKNEHKREVLEGFVSRYKEFIYFQRLSRAMVVNSTKPIMQNAQKLKHILDSVL